MPPDSLHQPTGGCLYPACLRASLTSLCLLLGAWMRCLVWFQMQPDCHNPAALLPLWFMTRSSNSAWHATGMCYSIDDVHILLWLLLSLASVGNRGRGSAGAACKTTGTQPRSVWGACNVALASMETKRLVKLSLSCNHGEFLAAVAPEQAPGLGWPAPRYPISMQQPAPDLQ